MSGCNDIAPCPKCGGEMRTYNDWKPHDFVSGDCLDCGFTYYTAEGELTLEEVNDLREMLEMEPLKELRQRVDEHAQSGK